jgi:hypothetical protein
MPQNVPNSSWNFMSPFSGGLRKFKSEERFIAPTASDGKPYFGPELGPQNDGAFSSALVATRREAQPQKTRAVILSEIAGLLFRPALAGRPAMKSKNLSSFLNLYTTGANYLPVILRNSMVSGS